MNGKAGKVLSRDFFRESSLKVAPLLLGKFLIRSYRGREIFGMITETEAYDGVEDRACHASRGCTERTKIMFGPPGHFYVYLVYGMYWMLNIVTGPSGHPAAVLIRGLRTEEDVIDGPGKVTGFMKIGKNFNGQFASPESGLWVEDRGVVIPVNRIKKSPRIGVQYAGEWAKKEWRFHLS